MSQGPHARRSAVSIFTAAHVTWRWALVATLVWASTLILAYRSEVGAYLEARVARPVDFRVRDVLGRSPRIDERLKIYSIDDSTFAKLNGWVLSNEQWIAVFRTLAENKPKAIFVDAMFTKDSLGGTMPAEEFAREVTELSKRTPIVVGSFVAPQQIRYRERLALAEPRYDLGGLLGKAPGEEPTHADALPPLLARSDWYAYGPSVALQAAFGGIGHILYPGHGAVAPLIRLGPKTVLGHMALYLADERRIEGGKLLLDGVTVPIGPDGYVTVDFPRPDALYHKSLSMRGLLQLAELGNRSEIVRPGDVVLIIPQMYTGNADFKMTPFGHMPGGFIIAAMLNSVLSGQWLKPLAFGEGLIAFAALAGALLGIKLGVVAFWAALALMLGGAVAGSLGLFAFQGVVVPWLFPAAAFLGTGITVFAEKTRVAEKKAGRLRQALEGSVAPDDLKQILKRPESISFEARERVVTLMFIDVVGFSLLAENMLPRMAFENLKRMLATIGETIHQFGGIIDKTLGDGLLCYFGYRFDEDRSSPDHAEKALRCAIRIQEENIRRNLDAAAAGEPVYPLRIGINTSSCYLGDLGSGSRIDFTVVGNGVNFAKRLEGACEMHSILIGATTNDLVRGIGLPMESFTKRFIRIKHHSELVEAYEYDPFHSQPELRLAALEGFRKCANIERVDQRWPVHDPSKIQLVCDFGDGQLVNFSHTGLSIKLKQFLTKGTRLNISLDGAGGTLRSLLAKEGIDILQGEVRWGYADGNDYVHGILLTNIDGEKSDYLVQYLCEFAFARDARRDRERAGPSPKAS